MTQLQAAEFGTLMAAAQTGDEIAYYRLLGELMPLLQRAIRHQNRRLAPADLEDLVQDALLSIHLVRATYDPGRPFLPWMNSIARNRAIDWARRQTRRAANETADTDFVEAFIADTAELGDGVGDPEALHTAIARLPLGQRRAIELLKLNEMTLREASEATGASVAALKVACHRGIKALRAVLLAEA